MTIKKLTATEQADTQSRLAEATALLSRWCQSRDFNYGESAVEAETQRFLANQPAAPECHDYNPMTAPVPKGDMNGPHGALPCPCRELKCVARVAPLDATGPADDGAPDDGDPDDGDPDDWYAAEVIRAAERGPA